MKQRLITFPKIRQYANIVKDVKNIHTFNGFDDTGLVLKIIMCKK